jgi:ubiquinone/menaquinone biosynthesis C-methylase UbiE
MRFENSLREKIEHQGAAYLESFNLDWEFLKGKRVLDVGGNDGAFAAAAKEHGIDVVTVEQSPHLFFTEGISDQADYVGGDVYNLPFKGETFDFVGARYLAPFNTRRKPDSIQNYIKEIMRVVKEGGEFRVVPAPFRDSTQGSTKEVPIEYMRSLGFDVEMIKGERDAFYIFRK